jgi:hypothetical protein
MARSWKSRQAPPPTSITEIARRYHAAAVALAQTLGLSVPEVLSAHRESVTAIFIECGRCDLRLPAAVKLPRLAQANGSRETVTRDDGHGPETGAIPEGDQVAESVASPLTNGHTPPVVIPRDAELPCGGQVIADLKPAPLAMLISKTARLVHDQGEAWVPLLGALQVERARRLERGRQGTRPPAENV